MAGNMLESDGVLLNETTDKGEFVFLSVENNRSEETTIELPEYIAVTSLVLCSVVLGVGVLGNLLVIIVILTNKLLRSSTNLFLLNLSVADLLVLVTCTPTSLVEIITKRDAWIMGRAMCFFVPFVELSVSHTSVLTIMAITVERYYAICLPLQAGVVWTKSKACMTCIIAWLFAFGLTAPVLAMIEYTPDPVSPVCLTSVDNFWSKFYFVFIITVFFFIPLLILILLYRHIANHLVPNQIGDDEQVIAESSAVIRSRRQVVAMLIAVVFFFFACILPFKVLTLWIVASPLEILDVINQETYFNLLYFSRLMFYINSAINPILYNIMSSKFRDGFKRVFNCKVWTSRRHGFGHSSIYTNGMIQTTTGVTGLENSPANRTFMERMNSSILLRRSPNRSTITTTISTVHSEADSQQLQQQQQQQQQHFFVNSPSGKGRINRPRASTHSHVGSNSVSKKLSLSPRESSKSSFFDLKDDISSSSCRRVGGSQSFSQTRPNALSHRKQKNKTAACGKTFSRCSSKVEPPLKSTASNERVPSMMSITTPARSEGTTTITTATTTTTAVTAARTSTRDGTSKNDVCSPLRSIPSPDNQARLESEACETVTKRLGRPEETTQTQANEDHTPKRDLSPSVLSTASSPCSCPSVECPLPHQNHYQNHHDLHQEKSQRHGPPFHHHHHHHHHHHRHHHHQQHQQQQAHSNGDVSDQSPSVSTTMLTEQHHPVDHQQQHQEPPHLPPKSANINFTSNPLFHEKIGSDELVI